MAPFGEDLLHRLVVALQHLRLYGADHGAAPDMVGRAYMLVSGELEINPTVRIEVGAGTLTVQEDVLPAEDREAGQMIAYLTARRVSGLTFQREVTRSEMFSLVRFLALEPEELVAEGGLQEALQSTGGSHIQVEAAGTTRVQEPPAEVDPYTASVGVVAGIYRDVARAQPADAARGRMSADAIIAALDDAPAGVWRDAVARHHDELDPAHAVSTAVFATSAAKVLGVGGIDLVELSTAALLHDVGLFALPEKVRLAERTRNGPQRSWRHMAEGAYLLRDLSPGQSLPMVVALEHHGPPAGAARVGVLPQSRLIGLADYVDAVTAHRDRHRATRTLGGVLQDLLADPGPQFSAVYVRALVEAFRGASASGVDLSEAL